MSPKKSPCFDAILLSQIITEKQTIQIWFLDGDSIISQVRWHTTEWIGLTDGKVVNKQAIKYWEILDSSKLPAE